MSGRDTPDYMSTVQRQSFELPNSPFDVAASSTKTFSVNLDTTLHTVLVMLSKVAGTITVQLVGDVTTYKYLESTSVTAEAIYRIAVASAFDTTATLTITTAAASSCTVNVGAASDPLSLSINNTVTTSGNVNVTNTVAVSGAVQATFPSAQDITIAGQTNTLTIGGNTNSTVINDYLSTSTLVELGTFTFNTAAGIANGSYGKTNSGEVFTTGFFDGFVASIHSKQGYQWEYSWSLNYTTVDASVFNLPVTITKVFEKYSGVNGDAYLYIGDNEFDIPTLLSNIGFACFNNTGSTFANADTITVTLYGKKATIQAYAPDTKPINTNSVHGNVIQSGQIVAPVNQATITTLSGSANVVVKRMIISAVNNTGATSPAGAVIEVEIGGTYVEFLPIDSIAVTGWIKPWEIDFGDGVATTSNGIVIAVSPQDSGGTGNWTVYPTFTTK